MDQTARKINVGKLRAGKVTVMLVTDVAARGVDIPLIDNVINYDFPAKPKLFVHRAGRAARAGRVGRALSFVASDEVPYVVDLHLFLSRPLQVVPLEVGGAGSADETVSWCDTTALAPVAVNGYVTFSNYYETTF
jgi:ATP-dependent RNA helicase DDX54/DBP10